MPFSRDETLKYVSMQHLDEHKLKAIAKLHHDVEQKKIAPQKAALLESIEQTKAFDRIFLSEGVEENDIAVSMDAHQIDRSQEWGCLTREVSNRLLKLKDTFL